MKISYLKILGELTKIFKIILFYRLTTSSDIVLLLNFISFKLISDVKKMFPPGIEPGTFRVLGGCDNHYTTETDEIDFFILGISNTRDI